ncbi:MAG: aminotransferase class I/II-fold pyridoxal phosphate-dependent enzyme [Phycisphaerales bacterium]|nr:MAG: aminotransferase class I/II-fold pyridoxal phosphate-dependent enzyme [Phycisphaerales bacterium]
MDVSHRVRSLAPSSTVAMMNRAKTLIAQGVDVLSFSAGEPDFDTPRKIKDAAIEALLAGQTKYMPTAGDMETRKVVAEKLARENGIPGVKPEHVVISAGGKHSLFVLFHCLFDAPREGEAPQEAVLPVPAWVSYAPQIALAGGKVVEVEAGPDQEFKITAPRAAARCSSAAALLG